MRKKSEAERLAALVRERGGATDQVTAYNEALSILAEEQDEPTVEEIAAWKGRGPTRSELQALAGAAVHLLFPKPAADPTPAPIVVVEGEAAIFPDRPFSFWTRLLLPGATEPTLFVGDSQNDVEGATLAWLTATKGGDPGLRLDQIRWNYEPKHPPAKVCYHGSK